jgi:hypothetical protein
MTSSSGATSGNVVSPGTTSLKLSGWSRATTHAATTASIRKATATRMRLAVPILSTYVHASQGPNMAPKVPPTATTPKSRFDCSSENRSTMRAQKTVVLNRLKTLNQT